MKKWVMAVGLAATLAIPAFAKTTTWNLDPPHSNAQFVIRHMGISNVQGDFSKITGAVQLDDQDISKSSLSVTVDMSSVDSRVPARDEDLKSAHYFDVAKYPTMTFQSTKIVKTGDGTARMTGNLTLHGITKEVSFDVVGPTGPVSYQGTRRGAQATGKISRKDFDIGVSNVTVSDEVSILLDVEMVLEGSVPPAPARGPAPAPKP